MAHMLNVATVGVGAFTMPPLFEVLFTLYGWRGSFQIFSAIMTNICVCGLLLRPQEVAMPLQSHQNLSRLPEDTFDHKTRINNDDSSVVKDNRGIYSSLLNDNTRTTTDIILEDRRTNIEGVLVNCGKRSNTDGVRLSNNAERTNSDTCATFLRDVAKDFDLSLFHNVRFIFQTVINGFLQGGITAAMIYLVPYSISVGISPTKSSFLMIAYGVTTLLVRLSPIGMIVDKNIVSASRLGGVTHLILGLIVITTPLITRFEYLMVFAVLYGLLMAVGGCMLYVIVARSPGSREKGPAADAWFLVSTGIAVTVIMFLVGTFQFTNSKSFHVV